MSKLIELVLDCNYIIGMEYLSKGYKSDFQSIGLMKQMECSVRFTPSFQVHFVLMLEHT